MVELEGLRVERGGTPVLHDLTFQVRRGQVYVLLGGNGAGKSTTLLTLLGLIPPAGGSGRVQGRDIVHETLAVRRSLAYLPDTPALYPHLSARENLTYFLALAGRNADPQEVEQGLAQMGLAASTWSKRVDTYSKGMRQKVAIALALLRDTPVLLLDEPTSGLDPSAMETLVGLWLLLAVLAPPTLTKVVEHAVPVPQGADILLAQREVVNGAWDRPKAETMEAFVSHHPAYRGREHVVRPFEWKWYFAFQQVGDQQVEALSRRYRQGREERDRLNTWLSFLSPTFFLERTLQALARTDLQAALDYEDAVRDFHAGLRAYYYPKLFAESALDADALETRPSFAPRCAAP